MKIVAFVVCGGGRAVCVCGHRRYGRLFGQYNDCVMRTAAQAASTGKYNLATNNCQSWADRTREQYEKLMKLGIGPAACGL